MIILDLPVPYQYCDDFPDPPLGVKELYFRALPIPLQPEMVSMCTLAKDATDVTEVQLVKSTKKASFNGDTFGLHMHMHHVTA